MEDLVDGVRQEGSVCFYVFIFPCTVQSIHYISQLGCVKYSCEYLLLYLTLSKVFYQAQKTEVLARSPP